MISTSHIHLFIYLPQHICVTFYLPFYPLHYRYHTHHLPLLPLTHHGYVFPHTTCTRCTLPFTLHTIVCAISFVHAVRCYVTSFAYVVPWVLLLLFVCCVRFMYYVLRLLRCCVRSIFTDKHRFALLPPFYHLLLSTHVYFTFVCFCRCCIFLVTFTRLPHAFALFTHVTGGYLILLFIPSYPTTGFRSSSVLPIRDVLVVRLAREAFTPSPHTYTHLHCCCCIVFGGCCVTLFICWPPLIYLHSHCYCYSPIYLESGGWLDESHLCGVLLHWYTHSHICW